MDNGHDLLVDCRVTLADGYGKRETAKAMAMDRPIAKQKIITAERNYDTP
jgi:hypothetical protein